MKFKQTAVSWHSLYITDFPILHRYYRLTLTFSLKIHGLNIKEERHCRDRSYGQAVAALNCFQRRAGALIIGVMLALAVFHKPKKDRACVLFLHSFSRCSKKGEHDIAFRFRV